MLTGAVQNAERSTVAPAPPLGCGAPGANPTDRVLI